MPINTWSDYKTTVITTKALKLQYTENSSGYEVYASEASVFIWNIFIPKDGGSDVTDFETNYKALANKAIYAKVDVSASQPFASKILPDGKKLYKRVHGFSGTVSGAADNLDFVIPYDNCKLTGIEIVGGSKGDVVNLKILDTPTGTVSGIANYTLNQFGFSVNVADDYYEHKSEYDADLIKDLKIRLEYDGSNSDVVPKTVYVNIILNEVKP